MIATELEKHSNCGDTQHGGAEYQTLRHPSELKTSIIITFIDFNRKRFVLRPMHIRHPHVQVSASAPSRTLGMTPPEGLT